MQYYIESKETLDNPKSFFLFDKQNINKLEEFNARVNLILDNCNNYKKSNKQTFDNFLQLIDNYFSYKHQLNYNELMKFLVETKIEIQKAHSIFTMPLINVNEIKIYFPSEILLFQKNIKKYLEDKIIEEQEEQEIENFKKLKQEQKKNISNL